MDMQLLKKDVRELPGGMENSKKWSCCQQLHFSSVVMVWRLAPQFRLLQRLQLRLPQRPLCITGHPPRRRPLHISRFRLRRKLALSAAPPCPTGPASLGSGGDPGIGDWLLSPAYFSVSNSACHSAHFASLGIRQSPRGDRATEPTLGPSGRQLRLNCWVKKRR